MVVLVTGASGGIGSVISSALKEANIEVIEPSSKKLNLDGEFDVSSYPTLDGFIHCAGINKLADHKNVCIDELYHLFGINTVSFVELCGKLKFSQHSNVIAIGSLYATQTKESRIQYTMSKHALYGAVKTLALEKASDGVKVNMISPGFVDTPLTRKNNTTERINYLNSIIPLGLTDPWEIANLCVYLIMFNKAITGQNIIVDGGFSIY
jgi:NAD(P)-dependent dehydrogenase (short-subunit alcohol dehydrogenase family)